MSLSEARVRPGGPSTHEGTWPLCELSELTPRGKKNAIVDGPFGSNLKTEHYRSSGIPIITSGYVTSGNFHASGYTYVDQNKFEAEKRSAVYPGDIVMAKIGARCGASAVLPGSHEVGILSGNALKISIDESRHSTEYVAIILRWLYERGDLEVLRSTGAQPAISMPLLKRLSIPTPPLAMQRKIAKAVSDADNYSATLDRLIAKKQAIKQGMMQQLLTGRTRLPGFTKAWVTATIGDLAEIVSGGTPQSSVASYWDGGISWCTPTDITRERSRYLTRTERTISREGLEHSAAQLLPVGSLLLCTRATVGDVKIAITPVATNQGFKSLVPRQSVSNEFLYYKMLTLKEELASRGSGSTFLEVSKRDVTNLRIKVPDYAEQIAIASALGDADDALAVLGQRLVKARDVKVGMMQQLLTGRTRLPVTEGAEE